ncbi:MAG: DUF674 domain-containing protein, partial [Phycisphaeraceae bacterium]|nr:DUF674 domain-containing protein [Phycisphaeraceae bacterium]
MARTPGLKTMPLGKVAKLIEKEREEQWDVYTPVEELRLDVNHSL